MQHRKNHSLARTSCEVRQMLTAQLPGVNFVLRVINPQDDVTEQHSDHMCSGRHAQRVYHMHVDSREVEGVDGCRV